MNFRESKIASEITAKAVESAGVTYGYRMVQNNLVVWAEGRTNQATATLSQLKRIGESVRSMVYDTWIRCPFLKGSNYSETSPTYKGSNKGIYVVMEIWVARNTSNIFLEDYEAAIEWFDEHGVRERRPASRI
jgi:hypothetical protein